MKYTYINLEGNIAETEDVIQLPNFIEQIGKDFFEKRPVEVEKITKVEDVVVIPEFSIEDEAKLFLKEKKIKGFGLLKGQKIIDRAIKEGFIIQ